MKYLKEIAIIFGITMTGELLNQWILFPVPAGVYGLFILLGLFMLRGGEASGRPGHRQSAAGSDASDVHSVSSGPH